MLCTARVDAPTDPKIREVLARLLGDIEGHIRERIEREASDAGRAAGLARVLSAVLVSVAVQARAWVPVEYLMEFASVSLRALFPKAVLA